MIACCDVDDLHAEEFNAHFDIKLALYRDYRKLLENETPAIVTVGIPGHWHVPMATTALQAGCDVCCENPLTLMTSEGMKICKNVKETGRVFQVGTQQRSEHAGNFLKAIGLSPSGRLGRNPVAYVAIGRAPSERPFDTTFHREVLDWNLWLGPAPGADLLQPAATHVSLVV
jgi:predicted dehydrogenase